MADETVISDLDKRLIVCPLCEKLGYGQNYRCTERPNKGHIECRPVGGSDKPVDAFADAHRKVLNSPKGEPVEVMDSRGEMITLRGLGFENEQALRFSMKAGLAAREKFVHRVNSGEIKAPRKNWDKTYVPEKTVTWEDPKTHETMSFQIGGGVPLDDLKKEFPDLYGTKTTSKKSGDTGGEEMVDDDAFISEVNKDLETSDMEDMADDVEGEGAYSEEEEPSYAAVETAGAETVADDMFDEDDTPPKTRLSSSAATTTHEHSMTIQAPKGATEVRTNALTYKDPEGAMHTMYKVKHPDTGRIVWLEAGMNQIDGAMIELKIKS